MIELRLHGKALDFAKQHIGRLQPFRRYRYDAPRAWLVPLARWRQVWAVLPQLAALERGPRVAAPIL